MIQCKTCQAENSDDSRFCKICGASLAEARAEEERPKARPEDIDRLLKEGYQLFHDGAHQEAIYLAEAVLNVDPDNTSALALCAMGYESDGDIEKAVSTLEQIVLLNPDSTLDRIKLAQLRKQLSDRPADDDLEYRSRNWTAVFAASAVALIFIALGVTFAIASRPKQEAASEADRVASNEPVGFATSQIPNFNSTGDAQTSTAGTNNSTTPLGTNQSGGTVGGSSRQSPFAGSVPIWDPRNVVITPSQNNSGSGLPDPNEFSSGSSASGGGNTSGGNTGRVEDPEENRGSGTTSNPTTTNENRGFVDIRPHSGNSNTGGADVSDNAYRVGQEKMRAGDYRGAISAFTASLNGSTKPAITHQFIGRCYKALGDRGSAKQHFQTAMELFERAGNATAAKTCRQEIEALGG